MRTKYINEILHFHSDDCKEMLNIQSNYLQWITESQFWEMVLKSEHPEAKHIREMLCNRCLPDLRKYGMFMPSARAINYRGMFTRQMHTYNRSVNTWESMNNIDITTCWQSDLFKKVDELDHKRDKNYIATTR
mgnify:CR=1 FL=1